MSSKKVYIKTQGCQMNEYDSAKISDVLEKNTGYVATSAIDEADLIVLNTCSIREKAEEKVFSELGRWRELKRQKPHLLIGVGGCVASQEGKALIKRAPYVDVVFGPQTLHRLPQLLKKVLSTGQPAIDISFPEIEKFDKLPEPRADGPTAFVSIMEGCSKYCSYCVVPYTRGAEISRSLDEVLAEVVELSRQGVKEITFLGQNVNDYRGSMHNGEYADLALLIHCTASIEGIGRIRFSTSHPTAFSDNLIEAYATQPKLANQLHLPVQSGSNKILAAMKRGYTRERYIERIKKLRAVRPDITISTDLIVGFPGETNKDFEDTMNLVEEINFDQSYSFIFSPRPGTPAVNLKDETPMEIKKQRLKILQDRLDLHRWKINEEMVGTVQRILVERPATKRSATELMGRSENNRMINFQSKDRDLIGQWVNVRVTEMQPNSLRGELI